MYEIEIDFFIENDKWQNSFILIYSSKKPLFLK